MKATRLWSGLRAKANLCAAILLAAAYSDITSRDSWGRIWHAMTLWFGLFYREPFTDPETTRLRLEVCQSCPIYWKPLGTCGSPLAENKRQGCWCCMAEKAKFRDATCWLDDELGDDAAPLGWKANLSYSR